MFLWIFESTYMALINYLNIANKMREENKSRNTDETTE